MNIDSYKTRGRNTFLVLDDGMTLVINDPAFAASRQMAVEKTGDQYFLDGVPYIIIREDEHRRVTEIERATP